MLSESYQWRANKQKNEYQGGIQTEKSQHFILSLLRFKILLASYKTLQKMAFYEMWKIYRFVFHLGSTP